MAALAAASTLDQTSAAGCQALVAAVLIAAAAAHTVGAELADLAVEPADMAFEAVAVVRS